MTTIKLDTGTQYHSHEFKLVVKDKDGNIKQETDWQHNLMLENGLKAMFSVEAQYNDGNPDTKWDNYLPESLILGTGSSEPTRDQIALDNALVRAGISTKYNPVIEEPTDTLHPNYLKITRQYLYKYTFNNNWNITELGLACKFDNINKYILCTRALIRDTNNQRITITVLGGEILYVYYKIHCYIDIQKRWGEFTLKTIHADNSETLDTFEYFIQPFGIDYDCIGSNVSPYYMFNSLWTYGVKETDEELAELYANGGKYSLEQEGYNNINYTSISSAKPLFSSSYDKYSSWNTNYDHTNSKLNDDYLKGELLTHDYSLKKITMRHTTGINTHNFSNGIRAFQSKSSYIYTSVPVHTICHYFVVCKNKANGQGIKKTNTHEWTLEWTYTMGMWEGDD